MVCNMMLYICVCMYVVNMCVYVCMYVVDLLNQDTYHNHYLTSLFFCGGSM